MIDWFIIFCCWIVSFFFNGLESGLLSIDPVRFRQNLKRGVPAARRLDRGCSNARNGCWRPFLLCTNAADILGLLLLTRHAGWIVRLRRASSSQWPSRFPVYLCPAVGTAQIVVPAISFSRASPACRGARVRVEGVFTSARTRCTSCKLILPARAAKRARLFAAREELKQITTESEREGSPRRPSAR